MEDNRPEDGIDGRHSTIACQGERKGGVREARLQEVHSAMSRFRAGPKCGRYTLYSLCDIQCIGERAERNFAADLPVCPSHS
jgi:hypothetical protein